MVGQNGVSIHKSCTKSLLQLSEHVNTKIFNGVRALIIIVWVLKLIQKEFKNEWDIWKTCWNNFGIQSIRIGVDKLWNIFILVRLFD